MSDIQPWRPPVPPKPTSAAVRASSIATRNARPAPSGSNDAANTALISKAALAAAAAGHARTKTQQDAGSRTTSASPTRGRSQFTLDLASATKRLEQSTRKGIDIPPKRGHTTSELAARLASSSSSPTRRPADTPQPRLLPQKEPLASSRSRSRSDTAVILPRKALSKSPDKLDFSKIPPLAKPTTSLLTATTSSGLSTAAAQVSNRRSRAPSHDHSRNLSPPKTAMANYSPKTTSQHPPSHFPPSPFPPSIPTHEHHQRKHSSSVSDVHKNRAHVSSTLPVPPVEGHARNSRLSPGRQYVNSAISTDSSLDADRIKDVSNLADAMVGASLASARGVSRTSSPNKKAPVPPSTRPRAHSLHALERRKYRPDPPAPLKPMTLRPMKHTLRKQHSHDEDKEDKHGRKLRLRKHPNVHHEGDRKRWRDKVTVKQRKRYEGLWAANRGRLLQEFETVDHHRKGIPAEDLVLNVVVRDIWERSRLPRDVLEEIWDLVAEEDDRALSREQFIAGLWLIDQRLKGRKLPVKVSPSVWASVRHPQGVKISNKRL